MLVNPLLVTPTRLPEPWPDYENTTLDTVTNLTHKVCRELHVTEEYPYTRSCHSQQRIVPVVSLLSATANHSFVPTLADREDTNPVYVSHTTHQPHHQRILAVRPLCHAKLHDIFTCPHTQSRAMPPTPTRRNLLNYPPH